MWEHYVKNLQNVRSISHNRLQKKKTPRNRGGMFSV